MSGLARRGAGPTRHVYDAIVLGGDLGGVLCTALLAKRGLQVLCVDHEGASEPYAHEGWRFPTQPFVMPPVKAVPALEECLTELGMATTVHRAVRPPAAGLQLLSAQGWLDLHADPARREPELARVLGPAAPALAAQLDQAVQAADLSEAFVQARLELPAEGLWARWKLQRSLARFEGLDTDTALSGGTPLGALLRGLEGFLGYLDGAGPLPRARLLGRLLAGPTLYPGGREGLCHAVAERARELGADVVGLGDALHAIAFEGKRPVGVQLERSEQVYRSGWLVIAADLQQVVTLAPEGRRKALAEAAQALVPSRLVFSHHLVVPEAALPRGLGELALLEPADAALGPLLVQVTAARRGDAEAPGERVLCVSAVVPAALRQGGEGAARAMIKRLAAELDAVMPFTREKAMHESTPWLHAPRILDGAFVPHPLWAPPADAVHGVTGLPMAGALPRALLAGRQVLPGLGLEGEALTALRAAARIEQLVHKADPLKHRKAAR